MPTQILNHLKQAQKQKSTKNFIIIDSTFGAGNITKLALHAFPNCQVLAIDKDPQTQKIAQQLQKQFPNQLHFQHANFENLNSIAKHLKIKHANAIIFDLGLSSNQLDQPQRGFSYTHNGPLDMRMDTKQNKTAQELINSASAQELTTILKDFGEEPKAKIIAKKIIAQHNKNQLNSTQQLANTIKTALPYKQRENALKRCFQALRIAVNNELDELKIALPDACQLLAQHGRLIVISFHSLEDRIVKQFFNQHNLNSTNQPSRHMPLTKPNQTKPNHNSTNAPKHKAKLSAPNHANHAKHANNPNTIEPCQLVVLTAKPQRPSAEEQRLNPRSHSAKLRAAQRS